MNITEDMRLVKGLEMIEEISSNHQSLNPKRDWRDSHDGIVAIYSIVHSLRAVDCRKNHPSWCKKIDDAIRYEKKLRKL